MPPQAPQAEDYHVGWITAIQTEYVVACELLDQEFDPPQLSPDDTNIYTFGLTGSHNVVVACLPKGRYGISSATSVAINIQRSFKDLRVKMMVGIGGGAPTKKKDIRLGDVVVSIPARRSGGVVHYEYGKTIQNRQFERTGSLDAPPSTLLAAVQKLSALHERQGHQIRQTVDFMILKNRRLRKKYRDPGVEKDVLFKSDFVHEDNAECANVCALVENAVVERSKRDPEDDSPVVHYGLIASADRLLKDALIRDKFAETEGVLCFEMEAAGLMDHFPCLVIRGICDYSDTHKDDTWQGYAAATAAAYAKELLKIIPAHDENNMTIRRRSDNLVVNPIIADSLQTTGTLNATTQQQTVHSHSVPSSPSTRTHDETNAEHSNFATQSTRPASTGKDKSLASGLFPNLISRWSGTKPKRRSWFGVQNESVPHTKKSRSASSDVGEYNYDSQSDDHGQSDGSSYSVDVNFASPSESFVTARDGGPDEYQAFISKRREVDVAMRRIEKENRTQAISWYQQDARQRSLEWSELRNLRSALDGVIKGLAVPDTPAYQEWLRFATIRNGRPKMRAIKGFVAHYPGTLKCNQDGVIIVMEEDPHGSWTGYFRGKVGFFPHKACSPKESAPEGFNEPLECEVQEALKKFRHTCDPPTPPRRIWKYDSDTESGL